MDSGSSRVDFVVVVVVTLCLSLSSPSSRMVSHKCAASWAAVKLPCPCCDNCKACWTSIMALLLLSLSLFSVVVVIDVDVKQKSRRRSCRPSFL